MAVAHKSAISFGLVHIPVKLYTAAQSSDISFNQLHRECGGRIRYKKACPECGIDSVELKDIVKGYEYEKGSYVLFEESDFEKIKTEKNKSISIVQFTDITQIDPIYYEKSYYVTPDGSDKAFALLTEAMAAEKKVAVAKTVLGTKEKLAVLRPAEEGIIMETMYFADEIKAIPKPFENVKLKKDELDMAKKLIGSMSAPFVAQDFRDEYGDRVREAIELKIAGKNIAKTPEKKGNVIDIMQALKASLEQKETAKKKKSAARSKKTQTG